MAPFKDSIIQNQATDLEKGESDRTAAHLDVVHLQSSAVPCPELPPAFAGAPVCARPWAHSTSAAAKVAPETWLDAVWTAAGLLDDDEAPGSSSSTAAGERRRGNVWSASARPLQPPPSPPPAAALAASHSPSGSGPDQFCNLGISLQDDGGSGDQLSTQLYRNKQLQDTLLQKEEELARLQEENSHLRQFLNSALVKQLEEETKKLLRQSGQKPRSPLQSGKRRLRTEGLPLPRESSHPQKARRNLLGSFSACEEPRDPHVDTWVLRTLGLKDLDTIDESPASANYSALTPDAPLGSFIGDPPEATNFGCNESQPAVYRCATFPSADRTSGAGEEPLGHAPDLPCHFLLPENNYPPLPCGLPCCSDASPTPTEVAFTTSLSPHCNVKTHTFRQGQAFVRRDEDGGWKLTWVPKQPE
ncbi:geminin coiled-coil domain-containing protein 1 [Lacerta agilis]|uniref:geminin coiled-coil domain-containing protein 1 n=1 Tax=Lacerta agilis TaxID=80427 RepID=UPI00141A5D1E|nr:geminin coiled-coil domain-containing protein 1 [Lacerta agilis]